MVMKRQPFLAPLLLIFVLGPSPVAHASTGSVLLEVTECGFGMSYPQGCRLYLRVYETGKFEYEAEPRYEPELKRLVWKTKSAYLKGGSVSEIIRLVSDRDFMASKSEYPPLSDPVDALLIIRIRAVCRGANKEVEVRNYMPQHMRAKSYYPAPLMKLLARVTEWRPVSAEE